jgi:hypothetical protein
VHGLVWIILGYAELQQWWTSIPREGPVTLGLDLPNTSRQNLLVSFSFGYLLTDTAYFAVYAPGDVLFISHHVLSFTFLAGWAFGVFLLLSFLCFWASVPLQEFICRPRKSVQ